MIFRSFLCALALLITVTSAISFEDSLSSEEDQSSVSAEDTPDHDFDFLLFTQRWPETTCYEYKKRDQSHTCQLPSSAESWTVHGIWPTRNGTKDGPFYCNKSMPFNVDEIKPLLPKLEEQWTNVEKQTKPYSFWQHEWEKHGTCASVLPPFHSENYYFGQGLSWFQTYAMGPLLERTGIKPDDSIYVGQLHNSIFQVLQTNPVIECFHEKGKQYITEIRICFNKQLKLQDCNGAVGAQTGVKYSLYRTMEKGTMITNCNPMLLVLYPSKVPSVHYSHDDESDENLGGFINNRKEEDSRPRFPYVKFYRFIKFLKWFTF